EKAEAGLKAQDPDQAIRFLKDAPVVAPDYYDAWSTWDTLHRERREWEATVATYERRSAWILFTARLFGTKPPWR
ncbi:MAG: hypothetical protein IPK21_04155, partial [Haliscomenobacter sp.]|nr:hypothetical protein [Haliscomenobacter sp.]